MPRALKLVKQPTQQPSSSIIETPPTERSDGGDTPAMLLAVAKRRIPENLFHDPMKLNRAGLTVYEIATANGSLKIVDPFWFHTADGHLM